MGAQLHRLGNGHGRMNPTCGPRMSMLTQHPLAVGAADNNRFARFRVVPLLYSSEKGIHIDMHNRSHTAWHPRSALLYHHCARVRLILA